MESGLEPFEISALVYLSFISKKTFSNVKKSIQKGSRIGFLLRLGREGGLRSGNEI